MFKMMQDLVISHASQQCQAFDVVGLREHIYGLSRYQAVTSARAESGNIASQRTGVA